MLYTRLRRLINIENIFQYLTYVLKWVGQCTCLPDLVLMFAGVRVGVESGSLTLVFGKGIEHSVVQFFIDKSKYTGFRLSLETVACLPFIVIYSHNKYAYIHIYIYMLDTY